MADNPANLCKVQILVKYFFEGTFAQLRTIFKRQGNLPAGTKDPGQGFEMNRQKLNILMGDDDRDDGRPGRTDIGLLTRTRPVTKKPSMYRVLLLNDDFTPMDFVIHVLERFFSKDRQEATEIMMHVHRKGVGVCGTFTYEVAETKVNLVMDYARKNEHPLQCTMEKE